MWNIILLLVVCWRITDGENNNIGMCESKTLSMNSVLLNRANKNDSTNCWCRVISTTGGETKVTLDVISFIGHQYKLSVSYKTATSFVENKNSPDIFYDIIESEEIKVKFERNNCSANDGLEFGININSTQGRINITCYNPTVSSPELCPTTTSTVTSTSTVTTTSTTNTGISTVTSTSPIKSESSVTASTGTNPTTEQNSEGTKDRRNGSNTSNKTATGYLDIGLIGGVVGGAVVLIVLILILIICLVKRKRRRKKDQYDQPSPARPPPDAGYTDVDLGTQGNGHSSPVNEEHNAASPRYQNTEQRDNSQIQMEIIENDLYVSSDDVINSKSNDVSNTSQQPEVQYAVVNKKRKPDKPLKEASVNSGVSASSNEPNSDPERKFVLGPKGDEYTLVTKT